MEEKYHTVYGREYRAKHPEVRVKAREYARLWRERNKETLREKKRQWHKNKKEETKQNDKIRRQKWEKENPVRKEAYRINRKFKLGSISEAQKLVERRISETCNACGTPNGGGHMSHIDHCHRTGKVRGILCSKCNVALGQVKDSVDQLKKLIVYLEKS